MAVKQFERSGRIDRGCNASFITLVPKVLDPSTLDNYRPISLIGSLYKIISKILAERLKKVISSVVSRVQTAFIAGRTIFDGPLILNETISWLRKTKSKAFIFKVDFEKAFDCLNWEFLDSTLEQMNFGMIWRSWIRGCLSSASVSVLLNGSPTAEFRMARGLRQGDPLAPFLFILAAEALHQAMETAKEKGVFYGIQLPNRGPCISHLQYADDAVFIGAWSKQNARNLIRILRCYELASGLRVNLCKSKFFGVSCSPVELDTLARGFNCGTGSFPFSYLGLPIGVPMGRTVFWNALIEKFRSRLSKWKAASLSFGGRLTLCKSVLGGLGSYFFSIYRAPEKVLEELERIRMRFFWGADVGKKKMTWIAWKKTLASKEKGGLGIGSLKGQNMALLGKWWWKFMDSSPGLWKEVIKSLHGLDGLLRESAPRRSGCWGYIAALPSFLAKSGLQFIEFFQANQNGQNGSRAITWSLDRLNGYTVASYSKYFDDSTLPTSNVKWDWNNLVPRKVNILAWRVAHGKLPTKENLGKIGLEVELSCKICGEGPEDVDHVFVKCPLAMEVWREVQNWWYCLGAIPSNSLDLLQSKKEFIGPTRLGDVNEAVIYIFMWVMWSFRNKNLFQNEIKSQLELASAIQSLSHLWFNARWPRKNATTWEAWKTNPVLECSKQ